MDRFEIGDERARFVLAERWGPGPMVGWVGMNPSKAGEAATDPTWMRWRGFAQRWGAGGQIAVNPVPMRNPDPDVALAQLREMVNGRDPWAADQMAANLRHLADWGPKAAVWVVGWGDKGAQMNGVARCHRAALEALKGGGDPAFLSFGLTASKNPIHALSRGKGRLADDAPLYTFRPYWRGTGERVDIRAILRAAEGVTA